MNVITAYLDGIFAASPQTAHTAEIKAELRAMLEDSYAVYVDQGLSEHEAAQRVIAEFGSPDELAPQLGDAAVEASTTSAGHIDSPRYSPSPITLDAAISFSEARRRTQPKFAYSQALFILSPAPLIVLATLGAARVIGLSAETGTLIGVLVLLACVAVAILLLLQRHRSLAPFAYIPAGDFLRTEAVDHWARGLAADATPRRTSALRIAMGLWIVAIIPVLAISLLAPPPVADTWIGVAVALMLCMFAAGVFILLRDSTDAGTASAVTSARQGGGTPRRG